MAPPRRGPGLLALAAAFCGCSAPPDAGRTRPEGVRASPLPQHDARVLGLRVRAGLFSARPEIVTESVAALASKLEGLLTDGAPRTSEFNAEIDRLQQVLDIASKLPGADATRVAEVRASVSRLKS